jgi:sensor histidine kinase YesM
MGFPWTTILQWVLPSIPELISTVRSMKNPPQTQGQSTHQEDLIGRIEKLEKALELQTHMNEERAKQLQQLQRRLQVTTFIGLLGLILGGLALAFAVFH